MLIAGGPEGINRPIVHPMTLTRRLTCLNKLYNLSLTSFPGSSVRVFSFILAFSISLSEDSPIGDVAWKLRWQDIVPTV